MSRATAAPDVSVLTPSLNYARFLPDAIESVRRQRGVTAQHIIQDGGSTDGTVDLLEGTRSVDWVSEPDDGQSDALNRALGRAKSEWIGWLNADEFYLPGGLEALTRAADEYEADVVYGETLFVDESGRFTRLMAHHAFHPAFLRYYGCYFASCSTFFRRDILGERPWDPEMKLAMDWELYLSLVSNGVRFLHVPYPVAAFRLHSDQVIARPRSDFSDEFKRLSRRHGVKSSKVLKVGRWPHDLYKLLQGAYGRQLKAKAFVKLDMRWFASSGASSNVGRFVDDCYGRLRETSTDRLRLAKSDVN